MAQSTTIPRDYRFRLAKPGATDLSQSTNVELEFSTTEDPIHITQVDRWGGQRVHARDGRTESLPWTINIAETSTGEAVTKVLSDSTGRPDVLRRFGDYSIDEGGGYSVAASGRVSDVNLGGEVADYEFHMQDETFKLRTATIWNSSNTTKLIPAEPKGGWPGVVPERRVIRWRVLDIRTNTVVVTPAASFRNLPDEFIGQAEDDLSRPFSTTGSNFENLALHLETDAPGDHGVIAFDDDLREGENPIGGLQKLADRTNENDEDIDGLPVNHLLIEANTISDKSPAISEGDHIEGYLHMFGHPPTELTPLHLGNTGTGIDQGQVRKDVFDAVGVRYDTTQVDALVDNTDVDVADLRIRITQPATNAEAWLHTHIDRPHGVAELLDDEGRLSPRLLRQPSTNQVAAQSSNLHVFSSSNAANHPSWEHPASEMVTEIAGRFPLKDRDFADPPESIDRMKVRREEFTRTDSTAAFGRHRVLMDPKGVGNAKLASQMMDVVSDDIFERYAHGPRRTQVKGMSDASTIRPGDWVKIELDTFPNLTDKARGGTRILQVLSRTGTPNGPEFELLEFGANIQPLSPPDLSMVKATSDPKHAIDFTVTSISTASRWEVRLAASTIQPTTKSDWNLRTIRGQSTNTVTRGEFPSGETIWGEARASRSEDLKSDWSTAVSVTLDAITSPSALNVTSTDPNEAEYAWSNGSTDYAVQVLLESSVQKTKVRGSNTAKLDGLSTHSSTETLTGAVRHVDRYGGVSGTATDTFSLSTNAIQSPDVIGLAILEGQGYQQPSTGPKVLF